MLVLTRGKGESIFIDGDRIKINFLGKCRGQTIVGIDAPKEMSIHRQEIYQRIQDQKAEIENTEIENTEIENNDD